jgi:hypothetical protein
MPSKVLLVYPPSRTQSHESCPAALTMLGAVLERAGHEVRLLDANATARKRSSEEIASIAHAEQPDVIGVTLVTPVARESMRSAGACRRTAWLAGCTATTRGELLTSRRARRSQTWTRCPRRLGTWWTPTNTAVRQTRRST